MDYKNEDVFDSEDPVEESLLATIEYLKSNEENGIVQMPNPIEVKKMLSAYRKIKTAVESVDPKAKIITQINDFWHTGEIRIQMPSGCTFTDTALMCEVVKNASVIEVLTANNKTEINLGFHNVLEIANINL